MDQLGNTEPTTEEPGSEDRPPDGQPGGVKPPCPPVTLAVYRAELAVPDAAAETDPDAEAAPAEPAEPACPAPARSDNSFHSDPAENAGTTTGGGAGSPDSAYPDGFTGTLALQNVEAFDEQMVGEALGLMAHLMSWVQALEARLVNRMEEIIRESIHAASGRIEPGMAFSLAASECAAILNVPQVTAQRMMSEALNLCGTHSATLTRLEEGRISYQHAQVVLDQCRNVPSSKLPGFEADLLAAAEGQTRAQFAAKARRLREKAFPETISKQHQSAFEQRKVTLDREEDGMSCLSAYLQAAEAQQIYTALSSAARGEQAGGDSRTTDQLRADILAQLLMGGSRGLFATPGTRGAAAGNSSAGQTAGDSHRGKPGAQTVAEQTGGAAPEEGIFGVDGGLKGNLGAGIRPDEEIVPRAEIMVLINAETLFGTDDQPAELHGYGPISAEAARRLARNAVGWTGLAQDPKTGEILGVGRRRKVPAGLRRWLRARDGTCRFPGCRVSTANSDIDHTVDWAKGGPTDHGNLEHLCRRHHRFKTLGYWKACQPTPGVIVWTSPTGRIYRTEAFLELGYPKPPQPAADPRTEHEQTEPRQEPAPPF